MKQLHLFFFLLQQAISVLCFAQTSNLKFTHLTTSEGLPQNAVFEVQGKQMIFVVGEGNKVQSKIIVTNGTSDLNFIVTEGLSEGDVVVVEGASKLKNDTEIVPQQKKETNSTETAAPIAKDSLKINATPAKK